MEIGTWILKKLNLEIGTLENYLKIKVLKIGILENCLRNNIFLKKNKFGNWGFGKLFKDGSLEIRFWNWNFWRNYREIGALKNK